MCGVKWAALVTGSVLLATAGYAIAGGTLRIIRLHSGQSVRIGTVKVIAVDKTRVVTKTVTSKPQTVTALTTVTATSTVAVTAPGTTITVPNTNTCTSPIPYPGDAGAPAAIAEWMARGARARRVPGELPVMAALVESGLRNLVAGDTDRAGYFGMRVSIWNAGKYAGFPDHPEVQLTWFVDQALAVWAARVAAGNLTYGSDPATWGEWVADVVRPPAELRYRYELRLEDARALIGAACTGTG